MANKSNLEEVVADILEDLKDDDGSIDEGEKALIDNMSEMVLAGMNDLRDEIEANETYALNEAMAHHAKSLIVSYAAVCVKMGQAAGMLDVNGQPTDKLPAEITGFLEGTTKSLAAFKEMYVKVHGAAAWEVVNGKG